MSARELPPPDAIRAALAPLDFFARYAHGNREGEVYLDTHARRFHETLVELADVPRGARVLELGAVPYYMTVLLERELGAVVTPLSFYEVDSASVDVHHVENTSTGERYAFPYRPLNVERDVFPVPSGQFDVVVCCEILEHLLINPSHMFYEAHRALVPGGTLLVSTPNVARWENVLRLAAGLNIYDRYHGNGVYGRHNREYTLDEVRELLQACGFAVERGVTRDVYPSAFAPGHAPDGPDRGDTLFVRARASAPARQGCPGSLYVLLDQYRNVLRDTITMGVNEVGHLGAGWHEAEWDGDQGCRWTLGSATCFLRHDGVARTISARVCAHHPDLASHPVTVDVTAGGIEAGRFEIATAGWQDATVSLPAGATPGPLEIRFAVDRTWSPSRAGGDDTRELGLRVARIGLS